MSGDVQGNTTNVIPNQTGQSINEDGEDEKILYAQAEKTTNELENIKLISRAEYMDLPAKQQAEYVRYNPSMSSIIYSYWLTAVNQMIGAFNKLGPMIENLEYLKDWEKLLKPIKAAAKKIKDLIGRILEMIGKVLGALSKLGLGLLGDILTLIIDLISGVVEFFYQFIINPFDKMLMYIAALEQVDWKGLKEFFDNESDETPSKDVNLQTAIRQMNKVVIPTGEIKAKVDQQMAVIKNVKEPIDQAYNITAQVYLDTKEVITKDAKEIDETITAVTGVTTFGITPICKYIWEEAVEKTAEACQKDYTKEAKDLGEKVHAFNSMIPIEYIKKSDLEILKRIDEERKAREKEEEEKKKKEKETSTDASTTTPTPAPQPAG